MGLWATWSSWRHPCLLQGDWTTWPLKVPSNPNSSIMLGYDLLTCERLMNMTVHNFKSLRRCVLLKVLRISLLKNLTFLTKVKSFHLLTSRSFSFHDYHKFPGRVALQFFEPVLWIQLAGQRKPVAPSALSYKGHFLFCVCMMRYECLCFALVLSLLWKMSLPIAMTAFLTSVWDKMPQWFALRMKFRVRKAKSIYALMHTRSLWEHCYEITHKS